MSNNMDSSFEVSFPITGSAISSDEIRTNLEALGSLSVQSLGVGQQTDHHPFVVEGSRAVAEIGLTRAQMRGDVRDWPVDLSTIASPKIKLGITLTTGVETALEVTLTTGSAVTIDDVVSDINTAFATTVAYRQEDADASGVIKSYLLIKAPAYGGADSYVKLYDTTSATDDAKDKVFNFAFRVVGGVMPPAYPYTITGSTPFSQQVTLTKASTEFSVYDEASGIRKMLQYDPQAPTAVGSKKRRLSTTATFPINTDYKTAVRFTIIQGTSQTNQKIDLATSNSLSLSSVVSSLNSGFGLPAIAFNDTSRLVLQGSHHATLSAIAPDETDNISNSIVKVLTPSGNDAFRDVNPLLFGSSLQTGLGVVGMEDTVLDHVNYKPTGHRFDINAASVEFPYNRHQTHYGSQTFYGQGWSVTPMLRSDHPFDETGDGTIESWAGFGGGPTWGVGLFGPPVPTKDALKRQKGTSGVVGIAPGEVRYDRFTGIPWAWATRRHNYTDIPNILSDEATGWATKKPFFQNNFYEVNNEGNVWRRAVPDGYRHVIYHDELEAYGVRFGRDSKPAPNGTRASVQNLNTNGYPAGLREERTFVSSSLARSTLVELQDVRDGFYPTAISSANNAYGVPYTTTFNGSGIHWTEARNINRGHDNWDDFNRSEGALSGGAAGTNIEQESGTGVWTSDPGWAVLHFDDENAAFNTSACANLPSTTSGVAEAFYLGASGATAGFDDMVVVAEVFKSIHRTENNALADRPAVGVIARCNGDKAAAASGFYAASISDQGDLILWKDDGLGSLSQLQALVVDPPLMAMRGMAIRLEARVSGVADAQLKVYWPSSFDNTAWEEEIPKIIYTDTTSPVIGGSGNREAGIFGKSSSTIDVRVGKWMARPIDGNAEIIGLPEVSGARLRDTLTTVAIANNADTSAIASTGGAINDCTPDFPLRLVGGTNMTLKILQDERTIVFESTATGGGGGSGSNSSGGSGGGPGGTTHGAGGTADGLDPKTKNRGTDRDEFEGATMFADVFNKTAVGYSVFSRVEDPPGYHYHPEVQIAPLDVILDHAHLDANYFIHGLSANEKLARSQFTDYASHARTRSGAASPTVEGLLDFIPLLGQLLMSSIQDSGSGTTSTDGYPAWMTPGSYPDFLPGVPYTSSYVGANQYYLKPAATFELLPTIATGKFGASAAPPDGIVAMVTSNDTLYTYDSGTDAWSAVTGGSGADGGYNAIWLDGVLKETLGAGSLGPIKLTGTGNTTLTYGGGVVDIATTDAQLGTIADALGNSFTDTLTLNVGSTVGSVQTLTKLTQPASNTVLMETGLAKNTAPTTDVVFLFNTSDGLATSVDYALGGTNESSALLFVNSSDARVRVNQLYVNRSTLASVAAHVAIQPDNSVDCLEMQGTVTQDAFATWKKHDTSVEFNWALVGDNMELLKNSSVKLLQFLKATNTATFFTSGSPGVVQVQGNLEVSGNLKNIAGGVDIAITDVFDKATHTLDDVLDGSTYDRVLATQLTSGQVDFSKAYLNKNLDNISDGTTYGRLTNAQITTLTSGGSADSLHIHGGGTNPAINNGTGGTIIAAGVVDTLDFSETGFTVVQSPAGTADITVKIEEGILATSAGLKPSWGYTSATVPRGTHIHDGSTGTQITYTDLLSIPSTFAPSSHTLNSHTGLLSATSTLAKGAFADSQNYYIGKNTPVGVGLGVGHDGINQIVNTFVIADHAHDGSAGAGGQIDYTDLTSVPSTFAATAHASSHHDGGADEIEATSLQTTFSPDGYTPTGSTLGGHLAGIDAELDKAPVPYFETHRDIWNLSPTLLSSLVGSDNEGTPVGGLAVPANTGGQSTLYAAGKGWKLDKITVGVASVAGGFDTSGDELEISVRTFHGKAAEDQLLAGAYTSTWGWTYDADGTMANGVFLSEITDGSTGCIIDTSDGAWYNAVPGVTGIPAQEDRVYVYISAVTSDAGTPTMTDLSITLHWVPLSETAY